MFSVDRLVDRLTSPLIHVTCPHDRCTWTRTTLSRRNAILVRDLHAAICPLGKLSPYVRRR
jgi:hypothetical protein